MSTLNRTLHLAKVLATGLLAIGTSLAGLGSVPAGHAAPAPGYITVSGVVLRVPTGLPQQPVAGASVSATYAICYPTACRRGTAYTMTNSAGQYWFAIFIGAGAPTVGGSVTAAAPGLVPQTKVFVSHGASFTLNFALLYLYACSFPNRVVTLTHIRNVSVEVFADARVVGQCRLQTLDPYYAAVDGELINVFEAPREFPNLLVVHNGLQGWQQVYGTWVFPS